jgi:hypothetical protein
MHQDIDVIGVDARCLKGVLWVPLLRKLLYMPKIPIDFHEFPWHPYMHDEDGR